jgi:hypothetical protein
VSDQEKLKAAAKAESNIIHAFGRKPTDPLPNEPKAAPSPVCDRSLVLVQEILERIKAGKIRGVGIVGLEEGLPIAAITGPDDHTVRDLAVLLMAQKMLAMEIDRLMFLYTNAGLEPMGSEDPAS